MHTLQQMLSSSFFFRKLHSKKSHSLQTFKRSNNVVEALSLPTFGNMKPRSVYNKVHEFHEFVVNEDVDIIFMSESWEREEKQ